MNLPTHPAAVASSDLDSLFSAISEAFGAGSLGHRSVRVCNRAPALKLRAPRPQCSERRVCHDAVATARRVREINPSAIDSCNTRFTGRVPSNPSSRPVAIYFRLCLGAFQGLTMGLTADLNVSVQSLLAATESMDVTTTNIANQNTPGYARRTVILEEAAPSGGDGSSTGVDVKAVQSMRDTVVDLSINAATAQQNLSSTVSNSLWRRADRLLRYRLRLHWLHHRRIFQLSAGTLHLASGWFTAHPTLTAADNVASSFRSTASVITQAQQQADQSVVQETSDANSLLQQIAATNGAISTRPGPRPEHQLRPGPARQSSLPALCHHGLQHGQQLRRPHPHHLRRHAAGRRQHGLCAHQLC